LGWENSLLRILLVDIEIQSQQGRMIIKREGESTIFKKIIENESEGLPGGPGTGRKLYPGVGKFEGRCGRRLGAVRRVQGCSGAVSHGGVRHGTERRLNPPGPRT
jgi:hypothetical protein